jgi:hypothetical protein
MKAFIQLGICLLSLCLLAACSKGNGSSSSTSSSLVSSSSNSTASSSASSSLAVSALLSGVITYDDVPHKSNHLGLDYNNIQRKPVRGLVIELLDASGDVISSQITNDEGEYEFNSFLDQEVQLRVEAQLLNSTGDWNVSIRNNTNANSLYAVQGSLTAISSVAEVRNLHIASGWNGVGYTGTRSAAPFAILDSVYSGIKKLQAAGFSETLPEISFFWSEQNNSAEGDVTLGEIGTSYFSSEGIYLLGDADVDTDEYDSHVILHEWTHYLENTISRSDSIGGDHDFNQKMDMRLAFSEGLANAFSAILQDDAFYADALGPGQSSGFYIDMTEKSHSLRGWYSEASIGSVLFNYYLSSDNRIARSFDDLLQTFTRPDYRDHPGFASIHLFSEKLQLQAPASFNAWSGLLTEQNIFSINAYGEGETNAGGYSENLPIYKTLSLSNPNITLCSSNRFGAFNRLSNYQFVKIPISQSGNYRIQVVNTMGSSNTDPDIYLYSSGSLVKQGVSSQPDLEVMQQFLFSSTYLLTLAEAKVLNDSISTNITNCFNLTLSME